MTVRKRTVDPDRLDVHLDNGGVFIWAQWERGPSITMRLSIDAARRLGELLTTVGVNREGD